MTFISLHAGTIGQPTWQATQISGDDVYRTILRGDDCIWASSAQSKPIRMMCRNRATPSRTLRCSPCAHCVFTASRKPYPESLRSDYKRTRYVIEYVTQMLWRLICRQRCVLDHC
jgi:hypothetical protein